MRFHVFMTGAIVSCALLPGLTAGAADERLVQEVDKLFKVGWQSAFAARTVADRQMEVVRQIAPGDVRAAYAYALVLIKQRRYADAVKSLDRILEDDARHVHAQKAKAWLSVLMRQHAVALVELEQLSRLSAKDAETARFLGTTFGFLDGPAADQISQATVADRREKIHARLDKDGQAAFESARRDVAERFAALTGKKSDTERKAKEVAERERELLLQDLETQRERMEARRKELEPARKKLLDELKAELADFDKQVRPLAVELARIDSQASVVRRELLLLSSDIGRLRAQADRERDPILRDRLLREADRLSFLARRYDGDLLALERRAVVINAQRAELLRKSQLARANYQAQLDQIAAELDALNRQQRRNSLDQKKGLRPAKGDRRGSRALAAEAAALTTYLEFPLEAEKRRVRDLLRAE